jgi:hypothetical protein
MKDKKLYIKIRCFACDGTRRLLRPHHHDPFYPDMWKACLYCDHEGINLIEAEVIGIIDRIELMPIEIQREIIDSLQKKHNSEAD